VGLKCGTSGKLKENPRKIYAKNTQRIHGDARTADFKELI
jgi:hypothetical protein